MIHPINGSLAAPIAGTAARVLPESASTDAQPARLPVEAPESAGKQGGDMPQGGGRDRGNEQLQAWSAGMRCSMAEEAQGVVVSSVDSGTGEGLRTVPADAVLQIARMIVQFQGSGVNTRV